MRRALIKTIGPSIPLRTLLTRSTSIMDLTGHKRQECNNRTAATAAAIFNHIMSRSSAAESKIESLWFSSTLNRRLYGNTSLNFQNSYDYARFTNRYCIDYSMWRRQPGNQ